MAAPTPTSHIPANLLLLDAATNSIGGMSGGTLTYEADVKTYLPAAGQTWDEVHTAGVKRWSISAPNLDMLVSSAAVDTCNFSFTVGGNAVNKLLTATLTTTGAVYERTHNGDSCTAAYGAGGRTHILTLTGFWTDPEGAGATAESAMEDNVGADPTLVCVLNIGTITFSFTAGVTKYELTDIASQTIEGASVGWNAELKITGAVTPSTTGMDAGQAALYSNLYHASGPQEIAVVVGTSGVTGSREYSGNVIPTNITTTADVAGIAQISFTGQGTGDLTRTTAA